MEWIIFLFLLYLGYLLYDYFNQYMLKIKKEKKKKLREKRRKIAIRKRADYVSSPQYKLDKKREEERRKIQREQEEWERTHTSGGDCPMCGNNMMVLIRELPFEDECDKCKYSFTFVYKKIRNVSTIPGGSVTNPAWQRWFDGGPETRLNKPEPTQWKFLKDTKEIYYTDGIKATRPKPPRASSKSSGREPIPQNVKDKVWNRDGGKCVKCGSNKNLEFDHIIPFSKGGSNTYRNLQLLCENCNRSKSDKIG